ncbi:MAG: hypothetical protein KF887_12360 [Paracoccaceae bacterium]|nr:MAG: hypothetical protein KF887_12360 [Paracoccaceae bacterium]
MIGILENWWRTAGQNPVPVSLFALGIGATLCVAGLSLGLMHVTFHGVVADVPLSGFRTGMVKNVGFLYAPNWGVSCIVFIPLILLFLCAARGTIEPTLEALVDRELIRRVDGAPVDKAAFIGSWNALARRCLWVFPVVFVLVFWLIIVEDFVPVVLRWLNQPEVAAGVIPTISLSHGTYEFDWSVAALFPGSGVDPTANILFSGAAYIWVALIFASVMVAGLFWFAALPMFLGAGSLARQGLLLVPDPYVHDDRCGFEVFEPLFFYLCVAGLLTAFMALGVHLQNVFLRAPDFSDLHDMVFGSLAAAVRDMSGFRDIGTVIDRLLSVGAAMDVQTVNLQFVLTGIGLFLIMLIVVGLMTVWLYVAALSGRTRRLAMLRQGPEAGLTDDQRRALARRLRRIRVWPVRWMSLGLFVTYIALIVGAMVFVNLLGVVIMALFVQLAANVIRYAANTGGDDEEDPVAAPVVAPPPPAAAPTPASPPAAADPVDVMQAPGMAVATPDPHKEA